MDITVVRLNISDIENSITVTDDDAKKIYDGHKESFHSEEQRKVTIAGFELSDAQKDLKGKDRTEALQALGDKAWKFAQAVTEKTADFSGFAKQAGAGLSLSAFFTATQPDPAWSKVPGLAPSAFKLGKDDPNSDVIDGQNGYYVLHLEGSVPSRQLSFDEAKAGIIAQAKRERAAQLMQTRANQVHNQLQAYLAAGKSISDAATALGLKAETIPPFSLLQFSKVDAPDAQEIVQKAIALDQGQLSDLAQTSAGGLFVHMDKREPVSKNSAIVGEAIIKDQFSEQRQMITFLEWLRLRKDSARIQMAQR
jgi:peptidyl-prolyl cis-trans isomerase D